MKYKIGDKVRVRKDLELDKKYGDVLYSLDMDKFKNKECVITKVGFIAYKINNSDHWWSEEMLEPEEESEEDRIYRGKRSTYFGSIFSSFGKYISCPCISW